MERRGIDRRAFIQFGSAAVAGASVGAVADGGAQAFAATTAGDATTRPVKLKMRVPR